jgi:hypothetical protein
VSATRAAICGHGTAHPDADECPACLHRWEREQADLGHTEAPCLNGHFGCAHLEGGPCHGDPALVCPQANCLSGAA